MIRKRVFVAMSGGVDSSVAAAILNTESYQVIGVTLQIWPPDGEERAESSGGCCGIEAIDSARKVARKIGIPHYVMNFRDIFARKVIADFCSEYSLGRTPNPCVACNQHIKFGQLLDRVLEMGADYLATGHYARVEHGPDGYRLLRAIDRRKDQSYFLYTMGQRELHHLLLPLGGLHKAEVRRLAAEMGLPASSRRESQDVCFIPNNDYRSFIARYVALNPGDIVDANGKVLGRHGGLARYTVGQRQGLGFSSNERRYVLKLDVPSNRLVVGTRDQLLSSSLSAGKLSWISGQIPEELGNTTAKIRYQSPEIAVQLHLGNGSAKVDFDRPQSAIAPGQAIVFYRGDAVLGGGVIEDTDTNFR